MKCASCSSEEQVQTHHASYEPEITVPLCKDCHKKTHGHSTGGRKKRGKSFGRLITEAPDLFTKDEETKIRKKHNVLSKMYSLQRQGGCIRMAIPKDVVDRARIFSGVENLSDFVRTYGVIVFYGGKLKDNLSYECAMRFKKKEEE